MNVRLTLFGVLLCAATALVRTQAPTFSSNITAVRVDVLVTDNGRPVLGLGPADFHVLDNGVDQQVNLVRRDQIPLNVILALDMSASMAGPRLTQLQAAGRDVLVALTRDDRGALVTFNQAVRLEAALTPRLDHVLAALERTRGAGNTALIDGAYTALTVGESDAGRALIIVFSDGVDTASWLTPDVVLDAAKRSDAVVYAVSARSRLKPDFLRVLTAQTGGQLFEVDTTADLASLFTRILDEFRQRYLVSYTPTGVARDGWHRLEVRVDRKAMVHARPGYLAGF
jgi:VWFA-related protein